MILQREKFGQMKLGIDIRPLLSRPTGVGIWLMGLLSSLKNKTSHEFVYFSSSLKDSPDDNLKRQLPEGLYIHRRIPVRILDRLLLNIFWPDFEILTGMKVDLTLSPTPIYFPTSGKKIITIHDLFFYEYPESAGKFRMYSKVLKKSIKNADLIIAVSNYTYKKLLSYFPEASGKTKVIYEGLRKFPEPQRIEALPQKFLLFVGSCIPRKNPDFAIEVSELSGLSLVIVGSCEKKSRKILTLGYVSDGKLRYLYENAFALVFPSLDEGFGLPVLEAMRFGLPVIALKKGAIPEVGGEAILYGKNPEEFAKLIEKLKDDEFREMVAQREKERSRNFSWEKAGNEFLKALEEL